LQSGISQSDAANGDAAAKIANVPVGGKGANQYGSRSAKLPSSYISQSDAAKMLGVSTRSVTSATRVRNKGAPVLDRNFRQRNRLISSNPRIL